MLNKLKNIGVMGSIALLIASSVQAEVFIINSQTLNPEDFGGTVHQQSLGDVNTNKTLLLQYYHYPERSSAAQQRRQMIQNLAAEMPALMQNGTTQQISDELKGAIQQMDRETKESIGFLSEFELAELKQLYLFEQQNERRLKQLKEQINKVKIVEAASPAIWNTPASENTQADKIQINQDKE